VRALRIVCAAAVLTLVGFAMALEFPALPALAAHGTFSHAGSGHGGKATLAARISRGTRQTTESAPRTGSATARNAAASPIVVAQNVATRSLAIEPQPSATNSSGAAGSTAPQSAHVFLANADAPNRIFDFETASNAVSTRAALFAPVKMALFAGQGAGSLGDGGAAVEAEFDMLLDSLATRSGVAVASDGTVFIADTLNSTIRSIAGAGSSEPGIVRSVAGRFGSPQSLELIEPLGLALDRAGNLYIADHAANAIYVLRASTGALEPLAHVMSPSSVGVTLDGSKVFASSPDTTAIVSIDTKTRAIRSVNIPAALLPQAQAFPASSGQSAEAKIIPAGLAVDGAGNLFVAFAGAGSKADQILRVDAFTSKVTSAAHLLSSPGEIAFDSNGNLFIADQGSHRILELKSAGVPATGVTLTPPAGPVPTDYGDEPIAGTTPPQSFTLTNNSGAAITAVGSSLQSGLTNFTVASTSCTPTLANNSSCAFNVTFTPQSSGALSDNLVVTYTAGANPPATLTAAVTGTGDDYQVTPASGFGSPYQITIDPGAAATFQLQIVPDDTFSGPVTLVCPRNLPTATTCTFTPSAPNPPPNTLVVDVTAGTPLAFPVIFQTTGPQSTTPASIGFWPAIFGGGNGISPARNLARFPARRLALSLMFALVLGAIAFLLAIALRKIAQLSDTRQNGRLTEGVRAWMQMRRLAAVFALLALFAGVAGVMGGCGSSTTTKPIVTPAGTSNLTVQATAQNASRGFTVTLVVN
jgi:sugar lactone lactonase YvrE